MNIGFLISVYDEIDIVKHTVATLNENNCSIIMIQSDPNDPSKLFEPSLVDIYKKLSNVAGSKEEYINERENFKIEGSSTPVKAITRNLKVGFSYHPDFHVDWWVVILGDVLISNLVGIKKIISIMMKQKKSVGITKAVGQTFMDNNNILWTSATSDPGDEGPYKSAIYKIGLFEIVKENINFSILQSFPKQYVFEKNKVEALTFNDNKIVFATDDENLGAAINISVDGY